MVKSQHHYSRYQRFMDALKGQSVDGYCEVHHIVPRSLGGSNDKDNLISLTPRQHYIAHWMLWKACGGVAGRSFFMMSNLGKYGKVNSTTYAQARENYSEQVKKQMAERPNRPAFTPEHREKLRQAKLGKKQSEQHRQNAHKHRAGKPLSEETKRKISEAKQGISTRGCGWKHSEETKMKMKQSQAYLAWCEEGNTPLPADE
jgi:NUMOD3 motif/HNH endonuclease